MELYPSAQSSFQTENFVNTVKMVLENGNSKLCLARYFASMQQDNLKLK